jgi:hypothetical protein
VIAVAGLLAAMLVGLSQPAWAATSIQVDPTSGPGRTEVTVTGSGFLGGYCAIGFKFSDANCTGTFLGAIPASPSFHVQENIPAEAVTGKGKVVASQLKVDPIPPHLCQGPGVSAARTFTVTATAIQVLGNPGFENGSANPAPWVTTARITNTSAEPRHSGSWDAWLGGTGTNHTDSLYQDVTVPAGITSATMTFWLHIDTADPASTVHTR